MSWKNKNLGDLMAIRTGKLDANASCENGEYPFFTCAQRPLSINSYSYDCECVLVAGNGDLNVKYYKGKFDAYQRTYIVEARHELQDTIHVRYVYHFLETYLEKLREQSIGGIIKYIKLENLTKAKIPLPPVAEQKRIAGILDAADALRAKRREALAQLDTLLQATFLDLFGDPVTNPKRWATRKFVDLVNDSFRNGLSPSTKGAVEGEVLTLSAITGGRFRFEERKEALFDKPPAASQMLSPDTFLICRGNGNKRLVGTAVFPDRASDDVCFPDTMIGATFDPEALTAPYLQYVWASNHVRQQIESGARTTNGTFKVNQQTLGSVAFPVPAMDEQKRFARAAIAIERQGAAYAAHLAELDTLFASLQSRAFRGEL